MGVPEQTIDSGRIQIERKTFFVSLRENAKGRFLRITEEANGRRNSVIIPAPGLPEFKRLVDGMLRRSENTPPEALRGSP